MRRTVLLWLVLALGISGPVLAEFPANPKSLCQEILSGTVSIRSCSFEIDKKGVQGFTFYMDSSALLEAMNMMKTDFPSAFRITTEGVMFAAGLLEEGSKNGAFFQVHFVWPGGSQSVLTMEDVRTCGFRFGPVFGFRGKFGGNDPKVEEENMNRWMGLMGCLMEKAGPGGKSATPGTS